MTETITSKPPIDLVKQRKDNSVASRWTMLLFMLVAILLAFVGNLLTVPASAIAVMVFIKGRTEIQ